MDVRSFLRYRQATGFDSIRLACAVKRRWRSKAKAAKFARLNQWKYGQQMPYECPICGSWHLTSKGS